MDNIYEGFLRHSGEFYYKTTDVNTKKPYTPKTCVSCGVLKMMQTRASAVFCSKRCSKLGDKNPQWTQTPKYITQHQRVYVARGVAISCVWGCESDNYHWANLTGDYDDIWDFAAMCASCHGRYDGARDKCEDFICQKGHSFEKDGYYSKITAKGEVRQCKQCAKDRAKKNR